MYGYVYKTTNLINDKIYIGQHKGNMFDPYYYGSGSWFKYIMKRDGKENFRCEVIEECDTLELLNEREIYWIEFYQSGVFLETQKYTKSARMPLDFNL